MKLSRKGLYKQVWTEPIVRLAQKYGFSDVWLAKICKRNRIPRPPRGYWARIQSGQRIPKTPLPKGDDSRIIEIITHDTDSGREKARSDKNRLSKKLLRFIVIPSNHINPHPLISGSARKFESAECDDAGLVLPQQGCLNIRVSRECLPRALNIMDSLIKSIIAMGFEVFLSENKTLVGKDRISISIVILEELDRRRRLKAVDHNLEGYYQFGYCLYEKRAYPSGRLSLSIKGLEFESHHRNSWRDTDTKTLEDSMKGIIASLIRMAVMKETLIPGEGVCRKEQQ